MYKPTQLQLTNLLSHRDTKYVFIDGVAVMVTGNNLDDDGQESNGSGKSALIEAISIALTGNPFRKVKDGDLIYYGEEKSEVSLTLHNNLLNHTLKIVRTLYSNKNKSSTLKCYIDDEEQTKAFPTVRDGNKWVLEMIGVSREDLINYFIVSKSKSVSFFGQSDTDKKSIVARFSGTDPLLPIKDEIIKDTKALEVEKGDLEVELVRLQGRGDAFQEQLNLASSDDQEKLKASRVKSRKEEIVRYESLVESLHLDVKKYELSVQTANRSLAALQAKEKDFKEVDYSSELTRVKRKETDISKKILEEVSCIDKIQPDIDSYKTFKAEIEQNLADSIECPKCKHTFILRDAEYNLEAAKEQLPVVEQMIEELGVQVQAHQQSIQSYRDIQSNISSQMESIRRKSREQEDNKSTLNNSIRKKMDEVSSVELNIGMCNKKIESYTTTIQELKAEISNIENEEVIDASLEISKKIAENNQTIKSKQVQLDELKGKYVRLKEFEVVFTKFITHLSNKAVKSIELRTNQYLLNMSSNLSIEIEGYKVNSDGSIREKFTTIVSRDGIPEAFIEGFSEGEQSRINIATTLALNSLLNMSCEKGKGLGLVVLDELMGSLDRLGVGLTMEALNKLNQTILAISHVEPKAPYKHTLLVTKENGYSTIKNI